MDDLQAINLRVATEQDVQSMAGVKLLNASAFARILSGMEDSDQPSNLVIKLHEIDIRERLAAKNAIVMVATIRPPESDHDVVAGWAMWKMFDSPQPFEEEPTILHDDGDSERTRLSKLCQADFKRALTQGKNAYTGGKRNIRE